MAVALDKLKPQFAQADVLRLVPSLRAKSLQNWIERGIVETPRRPRGKQGKGFYHYYPVIGVIMLAFMAEAVLTCNIPPRAARRMAEDVIDRAIELWKKYGDEIVSGNVIDPRERGDAQRMHIIYVPSADDYIVQKVGGLVSIAVEVDLLIFGVFNRINKFLHEQGEQQWQ